MKSKISLRQRIALIVIAVTDVLMLAAAAVLDSLRERFSAAYALTDGSISSSHPLDSFGIAVAAALALVAGTFAFAVISIINSDAKDRRAKLIGFSVLFAASVAVVMFSYFWVRGEKPQSTATYDYTDSELSLLLYEERYADDFGTLTVFVTDAKHTEEMAMLAATDIHRHSESAADYTIDWVYDNALRITFLDGISYRSVQIVLTEVLSEEQLQRYLQSAGGSNEQEHDHDHE